MTQTDQSDLITAADQILFTEMEALETDRHQVANLEKNRAWLSLRQHLLKKREEQRVAVLRDIFGPKAKREPVNQREVDYARGMIETIDTILALPGKMKQEVERAK